MKTISRLFAKLFARKKTQTTQVVSEVKNEPKHSIRPNKQTVKAYFSPKVQWNGFSGTNENKKRHCNNKRHGRFLKIKHRKAV
jgi:hypothetical protein